METEGMFSRAWNWLLNLFDPGPVFVPSKDEDTDYIDLFGRNEFEP